MAQRNNMLLFHPPRLKHKCSRHDTTSSGNSLIVSYLFGPIVYRNQYLFQYALSTVFKLYPCNTKQKNQLANSFPIWVLSGSNGCNCRISIRVCPIYITEI